MLQARSGRALAQNCRQLCAAWAHVGTSQRIAATDGGLNQSRRYAEDALLKTALYDFNVEHGGGVLALLFSTASQEEDTETADRNLPGFEYCSRLRQERWFPLLAGPCPCNTRTL